MTDHIGAEDAVDYLRRNGWTLNVLYGWRDPLHIWVWMNQHRAVETQRQRDRDNQRNQDRQSRFD